MDMSILSSLNIFTPGSGTFLWETSEPEMTQHECPLPRWRLYRIYIRIFDEDNGRSTNRDITTRII